MDLITGFDVDLIFKWPHGRAERLARRGDLPFYSLPDGSVRFSRSEIEGLICRGSTAGQCVGDVDQREDPESIPEEQASDPVEVGGVHQPGIGVPACSQDQGGSPMLYSVYFRDGSVSEVEATSKAAARRIARELSDEAIESVEEAEDEAEEEEEDEDDFDDGQEDDEDDEED